MITLGTRASALALTAVSTACGAAQPASHTSVRYEQIPSSAYAVTAEVRAKEGKEAALRAITLPLVSQARSEPNNLVYFLHEDRQAPGHFIFYEIFATRADFEAHNATPHVQAWFAQLPALAEGGVHVVRAEVLGNQGVP